MSKRVADILEGTVVFLFIAFVVMAFLQVLFRYVFSVSLIFAEELSRYLFVTMIFLGMGLGVRERFHVSVELVSDFIKGTPKKILRLIQRILTGAFLVVAVWYGIQLMDMTHAQFSPAMGIRMSWIYMVIPLGCLISFFFLVFERK